MQTSGRSFIIENPHDAWWEQSRGYERSMERHPAIAFIFKDVNADIAPFVIFISIHFPFKLSIN